MAGDINKSTTIANICAWPEGRPKKDNRLKMPQCQNQEWLERLVTTDSEQEIALSELRNLLIKRLTRALNSSNGVNESFIEDIVQDALLKILDSLDQFQGKSKFTTWATTIAIRLAMTEMRRIRWKDISLEDLVENRPEKMESTSPSAEVKIDKAQLINRMYQIINEQLSEKQRTALLAELQGMPLEEIGRRTGSNRNAIYKITHDARKRLKKGLIAAGYSESDLASFQGESK